MYAAAALLICFISMIAQEGVQWMIMANDTMQLGCNIIAYFVRMQKLVPWATMANDTMHLKCHLVVHFCERAGVGTMGVMANSVMHLRWHLFCDSTLHKDGAITLVLG